MISNSLGSGLASGVTNGIGEATSDQITKSAVMARFKKVDKDD